MISEGIHPDAVRLHEIPVFQGFFAALKIFTAVVVRPTPSACRTAQGVLRTAPRVTGPGGQYGWRAPQAHSILPHINMRPFAGFANAIAPKSCRVETERFIRLEDNFFQRLYSVTIAHQIEESVGAS